MSQRRPAPVLFVHHRKELGGAPTSLLLLMKGLDPRRYKPHVFCPPGPTEEFFRSGGIPVFTGPVAEFVHVIDARYEGLRWGLLGRDLGKTPAHWRALGRAIKEVGPEIIHLNESTLAPAAWLARRRARGVVWHVRHLIAPGRRRSLIHRFMKLWADVVIVIDEDIRRCVTHPRIKVIHNSVDASGFVPLPNSQEVRAALNIHPETFVVLLPARLHESKGTFDLIEAIRLLPREVREQCVFLFVGGGSIPPEFFGTLKGKLVQRLGIRQDFEAAARQLVTAHGFGEIVRFVDYWSNMPGLYNAIDVVVIPSRQGGIGRQALEAAACGVPVIATTETGHTDVVNSDVSGLHIAPGDPAGLANSITRVFHNPELRKRLSEGGLEHAKMYFNPEMNARRVMSIYDSLLSQDAPSPIPNESVWD